MRKPAVHAVRAVAGHERLAQLAPAAHHHASADDAPGDGVEVAALLRVVRVPVLARVGLGHRRGAWRELALDARLGSALNLYLLLAFFTEGERK